MRLLYLLLSLICSSTILAQVNLTSSDLPIIVVKTNGNTIIDEPKITAHMGIIYNGKGQPNLISDPFNHYDGQIGIEIRGATSQSIFPKKSYGFETRLADGENNNVELLGMPKENDWVLHAPYSDKTLMRNALTYKMAHLIMPWAPRTRFVELVINDEYQGVYVLIEKIKRDKNRVNVQEQEDHEEDITGGYILKIDKTEGAINTGFDSNYPPQNGASQTTTFLYHYPKPLDITDEQQSYIQSFIDDFEDLLQSENYNDSIVGYSQYIDIESFINFLFVNEITRNVDAYRLSTFMYKDSDAIDGRLKMGSVWDFNLALGNANYCNGGSTTGWAFDFNRTCPEDNWIIHFWWNRLLEDQAFIDKMKTMWAVYRMNQLSNDRLLGCIDSMKVVLDESQRRNFNQWNILSEYIWPNNHIGNSYDSEIQYMKGWLEDRLIWLDDQFKNLEPIDNSPPERYFESITYPNPFEQEITIEYHSFENNQIRIRFFDSLGKLVEQHQFRCPSSGRNIYTVEQAWETGIYYYTIEVNSKQTERGKIIRY